MPTSERPAGFGVWREAKCGGFGLQAECGDSCLCLASPRLRIRLGFWALKVFGDCIIPGGAGVVVRNFSQF